MNMRSIKNRLLLKGRKNKKTIITILFALVAMTGQAQEIKRVEATPEDFMEHMALCGYEVYTYDISSLRDSVSGFTIVIREYNQQGMIDEKKLYGFRTKTSKIFMRRTMPMTWSAASIAWPRPSPSGSLPFSRTLSRPSPCNLLAMMQRLGN